jgi:hypothetical protein
MDMTVQNGLFAPDELPPAKIKSTLKPPPKKELAHFHFELVGNDTVRTYLESTYSLAVCCRDCKRLVEITPPELEERFGSKLGLRIADIGRRLRCTGEGGCGSDDIAVFPHLYDDPDWRWSGLVVEP